MPKPYTRQYRLGRTRIPRLFECMQVSVSIFGLICVALYVWPYMCGLICVFASFCLICICMCVCLVCICSMSTVVGSCGCLCTNVVADIRWSHTRIYAHTHTHTHTQYIDGAGFVWLSVDQHCSPLHLSNYGWSLLYIYIYIYMYSLFLKKCFKNVFKHF